MTVFAVVGNGATWGKLEPKTKNLKKKTIQKFWILNFILVLSLPQVSLRFPLLRILKNILCTNCFLSSKHFHAYISRENLGNEISWNYSKITCIQYFIFINISKDFHEYIRRENLSNKIDRNYSKNQLNTIFCFHKFCVNK